MLMGMAALSLRCPTLRSGFARILAPDREPGEASRRLGRPAEGAPALRPVQLPTRGVICGSGSGRGIEGEISWLDRGGATYRSAGAGGPR